MLRRILGLGGLALVAIMAASIGSASALPSGGGCQLAGTAKFTPGLTNTAKAFKYSFHGTLSPCKSSDPTAPATGTVSAGEAITIGAQKFQEPVPTGNGTCGNGTTKGIAIVTWAGGTKTVISYSTTSAAAAVSLTGTVLSSVTLKAISPKVGQPTSTTIKTTRYAGFTPGGQLLFEATPTDCVSTTGVTSAGIGGVVELTHS